MFCTCFIVPRFLRVFTVRFIVNMLVWRICNKLLTCLLTYFVFERLVCFYIARQASADRDKMERTSLERQLADRIKDLADLQSRFDDHSAETTARSDRHSAI